MKRLSLIIATAAFLLGACERHTWEDKDVNGDGKIDQNEKGTKRLYEKDGHGGGADKDGHEEKKDGHDEAKGGHDEK